MAQKNHLSVGEIYEFTACGHRVATRTRGGCPECGGDLVNISVPRE